MKSAQHPGPRAETWQAALVVVTALTLWPTSPAPAQSEDASQATKLEFFEKKIRPMLLSHCSACHSAETKPAGGLRVDDLNGLLTGGGTGPAIVPGNPGKSLLLKRVSQAGKARMPLEGEPLSAVEVADLTTWIKDGAAWTPVPVPSSLKKPRPEYAKLRQEHWAWQPLGSGPSVKPPPVRDVSWSKDAVDRLLLARIEAAGLKPVGDADKHALLRRVTFDLTGLPPTPAEADSFLKDTSPCAFEHLVDRLLASPAYGERWGRHWLDVARFAESTGPSRNIPYPHAWRYRNYVIDAITADIPFDRFVREQIAGDLLPAATTEERNRLLTATGFLAIGPKDVNQRFKVRFDMDNVDEQIDTVSRSVLGLTVSCARCHDHKFDPVPQSDYYSLAGIFTSTDNAAGVRNKMGGGGLDYYDPKMLVALAGDVPPAPAETVERLTAEVAKAKKEWDAIRGTPEGLKPGPNGAPTQRPFRLAYESKLAELNNLTDPAARGFAVHGVRDGKTIADTAVRIRGEAEKLGPVVPRGYLTAFTVPGVASVDARQSGRLQLADWLTSPANPLTPRVAVNRVWHHLFGTGLVATVDNFGTTGDVPSHPELLDALAADFVKDGWSVKRLVRRLVLTRAYRLSADADAAALAADPANRLVWRHTPRRLDAEEFRDAVLATAGTLDRTRPAKSAAERLKMIEMRDNGPEAAGVHQAADAATCRSVYLPLLRGLTPHALEVFDPVDPTLVTGQRDETTVPSQALFLLNAPFVRKQSLALATRLLADARPSDQERVRTAYQLALGRTASGPEVERAVAFVTAYASGYHEPPAQVAAAKPTPRPKGKAAAAKAAEPVIDPDQVVQAGESVTEELVRPKDARTAAWLALAQALYASAEFRYLR